MENILKKKKKEETFVETEVDEAVLNRVVSRMKGKFDKEAEQYRATEKTEEIKKMVEEGPTFELRKATYKDLMKSQDKNTRNLASLYSVIRFPFGIFTKIFDKIIGEKLQSDLESAEMGINAMQYLSITVASMFIVTLLAAVVIVPLFIFGLLNAVMAIFFVIIFPLLDFIYMVIKPGSAAMRLSAQIDKQLPFALRHMAIEVKAGVSLFKTIQSIAAADYGYVSLGFRKVLSRIDKGMTTEEALTDWSEQTKSESLKRTLSHLVRAIRTGGNLSQVMVTIAEDVTFDRKVRISEYISKLNLLSLFLMMTVIVLPVMLTILTAIGSSGVVKQFASMFSIFSPVLLAIIYFVMTPIFLVLFMTVVKAADPE